jgi:hypothetical protein
MKPRIQCVPTRWIPGFTASGTHPRSRGRTLWNAMKPRIQCVPTPWIPGFMAFQVPREPEPKREPRPGKPSPNPNRAQTQRNPPMRGKPFLTASNPPADYAELPTPRTSPERIEGVSRSLPYSDLLALTSSHMFFSVMN